MPKMKLTKRNIDLAPPDQTYWDDELPGFGLRISGRARTFVLKYNFRGRQRWMKIARFGILTPDQARHRARILLGRIADGEDPAGDRREERDAVTLETFAARYIEQYAKVHKKPATIVENERLLKVVIVPKLGSRRVNELTTADFAKFIHALRETPIQANRARALLSHMMRQARIWGERADALNPLADVEKYPENKRDRFLSLEELGRLGQTLDEAAKENKESPFAIAGIRLLILTGARLSEILTLKWEFVDFEARLLRLPDSKAGKKTIALSAAAL